MKTKPVKNFLFQLRATLILSAFFAVTHFAGAQSVWNATVGVSADTNWTDAANWSPSGVPASSNVVFNFQHTVTPGTIDNVVNASITVQRLAYVQTNGVHNTLILPGVTLAISNALAGTNLFAGTIISDITNNIVTNTISGSGGTLAITSSNTVSLISVSENGIHAAANNNHSILDMSGLDNFNAAVGNIYVGVSIGNATARPSGEFILAKTNIISVLVVGTAAAPAIDIGDTGGSPDANNFLTLGITNNVAADTIEVANQRSGSTLRFNPAFTNSTTPSLYLRGHSSSRVVTLNIGDDSQAGAVGSSASGVVDFSGGTIDAMVGSMTVGDGQAAAGTATGTATGTLTMTAGTLDVNTLEIGFQGNSLETGAINTGTVNINGGTLKVNTSLRLAKYGGGGLSKGTLNITNGTVQANSIVAGGGTSTININGGTLIVTNTAGTTAAGFSALNLTSASLHLNVNATANVTNIVATNVTTSGTTTITIDSVANVTPHAPTTIPLISYAGTDPFGSLSLPAPPAGYTGNLVDNSTGKRIDLSVTSIDRAPTIANIVTNSVTSGQTWKIAITTLSNTAAWSDPDGDTVSLSGVGPTSASGTNVTSDATYIYYNGPVTAQDHFTYTVTDGSLTAVGTVYLEAVAATAPNISNPALNGGGHPTFSGSGIPTDIYGVESTTNIGVAPWVEAGTVTAGSDGSWSFTDTNQTSPASIFYRLYYPDNPGNPPQ